MGRVHESQINPYLKIAENRMNFLFGFIEKAKKESIPPSPLDSLFTEKGLDEARRIAIGHSNALELMENSKLLYNELLSRGVGELKIKAYLFANGIDLALRCVPGPFLIAASTLIEKLLHSGYLDELADQVDHLFDPAGLEDIEGLIRYFKKTPFGKQLPENVLRRKIVDMLSQRAEKSELEIEAYEESLKQSGYSEPEIPGYLLALGFMAGEIAKQMLPEEFKRGFER